MTRREARAQYVALCDRIQEFAHLTSTELLAAARRAKLDDAIRMDMEMRRRKYDSQRANRAGRGSYRYDALPDCGGDVRCATHRGGSHNMTTTRECRHRLARGD